MSLFIFMIASAGSVFTAFQQGLWFRIQAHNFEPPTPQNFTSRLAHEQLWSMSFTRGAIDEYRKFCFLAVTAQQPVTPSIEVDEVWHLHLIHSIDYWSIWCDKVLGVVLHHNPTSGGPVEAQKYHDQYAQTLLAYEKAFGSPPPTYWPSTHRRFSTRSRWKRFLWN